MSWVRFLINSRLAVLMPMVLMLALMVAPLSWNGLASFGLNQAGAVAVPPGGGSPCGNSSVDSNGNNSACPTSPTQSENCIQIALPVMPGMDSCTTANGGKGIPNNQATGGAIIVYLKYVLQLLSGAVGMVIVLMLVIAGIQYITSVGNPSQIKSAKTRIMNAVLALVLFLMMFAILQFLVPGGVL